jgi:uncharacterized membrane protein
VLDQVCADHGSIVGFLHDLGVDDTVIGALAAHLVEQS